MLELVGGDVFAAFSEGLPEINRHDSRQCISWAGVPLKPDPTYVSWLRLKPDPT
jgi:hypothetical protein